MSFFVGGDNLCLLTEEFKSLMFRVNVDRLWMVLSFFMLGFLASFVNLNGKIFPFAIVESS